MHFWWVTFLLSCQAPNCFFFFIFFLSAESLRLIPFFKQYEMNQCMIHGKELRWHSVSPFTGHLFLAYLTEMPRLRYDASLQMYAGLKILLCVPPKMCVVYTRVRWWYIRMSGYTLLPMSVHTSYCDSNLFVI